MNNVMAADMAVRVAGMANGDGQTVVVKSIVPDKGIVMIIADPQNDPQSYHLVTIKDQIVNTLADDAQHALACHALEVAHMLVGDTPRVSAANACQECGEDRMDELVWVEDDTVECQQCGNQRVHQ